MWSLVPIPLFNARPMPDIKAGTLWFILWTLVRHWSSLGTLLPPSHRWRRRCRWTSCWTFRLRLRSSTHQRRRRWHFSSEEEEQRSLFRVKRLDDDDDDSGLPLLLFWWASPTLANARIALLPLDLQAEFELEWGCLKLIPKYFVGCVNWWLTLKC